MNKIDQFPALIEVILTHNYTAIYSNIIVKSSLCVYLQETRKLICQLSENYFVHQLFLSGIGPI